MDALRPTTLNALSCVQLPVPPPAKAPRGPRTDGRLGTLPSITAAKPSPNSMAPVGGATERSPIATSGAAAGSSSRPLLGGGGTFGSGKPAFIPSEDSAIHPSANNPAPGPQPSLPSFLSRRPPQPQQQRSSNCENDAGHNTTSHPEDDGHLSSAENGEAADDDDEFAFLEGSDETALVDEAVFEQCLDLDEEEKSEDDLKQLAEELSVTTGLTHAEVLALLVEQQAEKQRMRRAREAERSNRMGVVVRVPQRNDRGGGDDRTSMFLTATPDVASPSRQCCQPPSTAPDAAQLSSRISAGRGGAAAAAVVSAPDDNVDWNAAYESDATKRMRQQLLELFPPPLPNTGASKSDRGGGDEGAFVDLQTYRAERAARQHARVSNHLASRRGTVPVPRSLATTDVFVRAYELEMTKRASQRTQREETLRKQRDDEERERKTKGVLCNLAIQQKIADRTATAKATTSSTLAARPRPTVVGDSGGVARTNSTQQ